MSSSAKFRRTSRSVSWVSQPDLLRLQAGFLLSSDKCIYVNYSLTPETIGRTQMIPRGALILLCQFNCNLNSMQVTFTKTSTGSGCNFPISNSLQEIQSCWWCLYSRLAKCCIAIIPLQREILWWKYSKMETKGFLSRVPISATVKRKVAQLFSLLLEGWKAAQKKYVFGIGKLWSSGHSNCCQPQPP